MFGHGTLQASGLQADGVWHLTFTLVWTGNVELCAKLADKVVAANVFPVPEEQYAGSVYPASALADIQSEYGF